MYSVISVFVDLLNANTRIMAIDLFVGDQYAKFPFLGGSGCGLRPRAAQEVFGQV